MTRRRAMVVVAVALAVTFAPTTLGAKKTPVDFYEVGCVADPGTELVTNNGREFHMVGQVGRSLFYDAGTFEVIGQNTTLANMLVKLRTGKTQMCGTFSGLLPDYAGANTFDGTFYFKIGATGVTGRVLGHGTFSFRHDQVKMQYRSVAPEAMPAELTRILSRRPWKQCADLIGPFRATGFIRTLPKE